MEPAKLSKLVTVVSITLGCLVLWFAIAIDTWAGERTPFVYIFFVPAAILMAPLVRVGPRRLRGFLFGLIAGTILVLPQVPYHPWKQIAAKRHLVKLGMTKAEVSDLFRGHHQQWYVAEGKERLFVTWDPEGPASHDQAIVTFRDGTVVGSELMHD